MTDPLDDAIADAERALSMPWLLDPDEREYLEASLAYDREVRDGHPQERGLVVTGG